MIDTLTKDDLLNLKEGIKKGFAKSTIGNTVIYDYLQYFDLYQKLITHIHFNYDLLIDQYHSNKSATNGTLANIIINELLETKYKFK